MGMSLPIYPKDFSRMAMSLPISLNSLSYFPNKGMVCHGGRSPIFDYFGASDQESGWQLNYYSIVI